MTRYTTTYGPRTCEKPAIDITTLKLRGHDVFTILFNGGTMRYLYPLYSYLVPSAFLRLLLLYSSKDSICILFVPIYGVLLIKV